MGWDHDGMRVMNDFETRLSATCGYHGFKLYVSPDASGFASGAFHVLLIPCCTLGLFCHSTRAPEGKRLKRYSR